MRPEGLWSERQGLNLQPQHPRCCRLPLAYSPISGLRIPRNHTSRLFWPVVFAIHVSYSPLYTWLSYFVNLQLLDTGTGGHLLSAPTGSWVVYTLTSHSSCVLIMLSSCTYICTTSLMRTMANRLCTLVILLSTYCENPNWGALQIARLSDNQSDIGTPTTARTWTLRLQRTTG